MPADLRASDRNDTAAVLKDVAAPLTISTADGELFTADSLTERLAKVRDRAAVPGSCNWSGWAS